MSCRRRPGRAVCSLGGAQPVRSGGAWGIQGGLGPENRGGCSLGGPARSPLRSEQLKGSCGWRELLGPERLTPHMAKVHRRLAIKGRTSLREKMTQGLLLCKQPQKKHRLLLPLSVLPLNSWLQMHRGGL